MAEAPAPSNDPITTIRVTGIPPHVAESEFNCWFLFAGGFEQAALAGSRVGVTQAGWARFQSPEAAQAAIDYLNRLQLTPEMCAGGGPFTLQAEIARKNFKPSRKGPSLPDPLAVVESAVRLGTLVQAPPSRGYGAPAAPVSFGGFPRPTRKGERPVGESRPPPLPFIEEHLLEKAPLPAPRRSNSVMGPATLFVWKLTPHCTEDELLELFQTLRGFERLKYTPASGAKRGQAFVKFATHLDAAAAMRDLTGTPLPSNPTESIQLDYAQSELDQPKVHGPVTPFGGKFSDGVRGVKRDGAPLSGVQRSVGGPAETSRNPPCDTMFVGGLPRDVTELELETVFWNLIGFEKLKLVQEKGFVLVQFNSIDACTEAMEQLQGHPIREGGEASVMKCEYSKNSLGKTSRHA